MVCVMATLGRYAYIFFGGNGINDYFLLSRNCLADMRDSCERCF